MKGRFDSVLISFAMSDPAIVDAASRLCLACGMCCNGVLFQIVRLQAEDSARDLEKLGMALSRKKTEPYFNQPCRFLDNCTCQIYTQRPSRCRQFECRQILALAGGDTTETDVAEVIQSIHRQVGKVTELLKSLSVSSSGRALPLMEQCREVMRDATAQDVVALDQEARTLNSMLNEHLRYQPVRIAEDWN